MNRSTGTNPSRRAASVPTAANVGRVLWGLAFVAASIVNLTVTLPNPAFYQTFADLTFFPFYRQLILNIALPNATLISLLVVIFEFTVGLMMLSKGKWVHWGLVGTGIWVVFITPAMGWYTIASLIFLIIPALLLRYDYNRTLLGLLFRRPTEESNA
jgi:hypothetical protein